MGARAIPPLLGWPLLPRPDEQGAIAYPTAEESVRQQIRVILATSPGELLMRPQFGAGLEQFLNQPNTITTRRAIQDRVGAALAKWEPRILIDRIDVAEVAAQPSAVRVEIAYRLKRTGAPGSMGLTMELGA
ncbi:MAG TPA: GPW/gp25 family protein [Polyangia bacterium]|nr:GPW/gp25 family protein [Polyangia bacterium]